MTKTYDKAVQYIKSEILAGNLKPGDRLPTERELAEQLQLSRNSVREGLRVLENIGVLTSHQGSGNYISEHFDENLSEVLSFMYFLKGLREEQVTEFRQFIEFEAMRLAVNRADPAQKKALREHLAGLKAAKTEAERVAHDRAIHSLLVQASRNDFLIANYEALTNLMDRYISSMRLRIIHGMQSRNMLEESHRLLAEGVIEGDLEKGMKGLKEHFGYIEQYQ